MKLRLWPWRLREAASDEPAPEEPTTEEPAAAAREQHEGEQAAPARTPPRQPASAFARPYAPAAEEAPPLPAEPPAEVSLTLEEAKKAIRAAGGDVIQIGFLGNTYLRHREDEPESRETTAARGQLCELVAKRLRDRKLLAPEGRFELLEEPAARKRTA